MKISGRKLEVNKLFPLHMCAYVGRIEIAEVLLDAGADPNLLDECKKVFYKYFIGLQFIMPLI